MGFRFKVLGFKCPRRQRLRGARNTVDYIRAVLVSKRH
jgi:hypothetical protein